MTQKNGFTLIELAIALMVIGLLIGGVLKGQELIENAKVMRMIRDMKGIETAAVIFKSTYGGLPGDLRNPGTKIPNCTIANYCVPTVGTQGDNLISGGVGVNTGREEMAFWLQTRNVGMLTGKTHDTETYRLESPYGGYYLFMGQRWPVWTITAPHTVEGSAPINNRFNHLGAPLSLRVTQALDDKMDDGKPFTGDVQSTGSSASGGFFWAHGPEYCTLNDTLNERNFANAAALCTFSHLFPHINGQ